MAPSPEPSTRYELKYWAEDEQARRVVAGLAGLLQRDERCTDERPGYTVTSLYFDTPDMRYFLDKIEGEKKRTKLRLRRYDDGAGGWVELKVKRGRRMRKWRVKLDAEQLQAVAGGEFELLADLADDGEGVRRVLNECSLFTLQPSVITAYEREAYVMRDVPGVRIVLDTGFRSLSGDRVDAFLEAEVSRVPMPRIAGLGPVIVELKVPGPVPSVVAAEIRAAELVRRAISKYCLAVEASRPDAQRLVIGPRGRG